MKKLLTTALILFALSSAQATWPKQNFTPQYYAAHITTNTTTTVTSTTVYIATVVVTCTAAGTTETITIKNKEGTAKTLYISPTLTVGTPLVLSLDEPVLMTSGIDIVSAGGAAATVDVFITYFQK